MYFLPKFQPSFATDKLILKFIWKGLSPRRVKTILKEKNKVGGIMLGLTIQLQYRHASFHCALLYCASQILPFFFFFPFSFFFFKLKVCGNPLSSKCIYTIFSNGICLLPCLYVTFW